MKKMISLLTISVIFMTCGNSVSHRNHGQNKTAKKDTLIPLNDTLALHYASYNSDMKLWYNLSVVKNKKPVKIDQGNEYKGTGSELFASLSPNADYVVVDAIIKGYVHGSDQDSTLHENYTCAIIDLKKAKIIHHIQQDCDGSWNKNNQWVSSEGKVVFE